MASHYVMAIAVACERPFISRQPQIADEIHHSLMWLLLLQGDKRHPRIPEQTWTIPLHPVIVWILDSHVSWCICKRANAIYARKVFTSSILPSFADSLIYYLQSKWLLFANHLFCGQGSFRYSAFEGHPAFHPRVDRLRSSGLESKCGVILEVHSHFGAVQSRRIQYRAVPQRCSR